MRWSWRIGRIAGIPIAVHGTFVIFLAWVAWGQFMLRHRLADAGTALLIILLLFGTVLLHELSHALTAKRFGIPTRDILLLPIGGVSRMERLPANPRQELAVALAGPALNLVLAGVLFLALALRTPLAGAPPKPWAAGDLLAKLFWVNISLAVFNLLPAFPMDGGRVLRAILALRMDRVQATRIAAQIGQGLALWFGLLGLFFNPMLLFIALFVWIGAAEEAMHEQITSALGEVPVSRAMITAFQTLSPDDALEQAVQHILAGFQQDFPVVEAGRLVGVLTRSRLLAALVQQGARAPVREVMQRQFETAEPSDRLERALARLHRCDCHTLPVVERGRLVGIVTMENIGELLMIRAALSKRAEGNGAS
jgi:Zn-dependent protease/predicted transcriptional regulator